MIKEKQKIIVVLGPTASGKSEMAVRLAKEFGGEVVSADSRQVYRGMDVGTGKVPMDKNSKSEFKIQKDSYYYRGIPHYLIDVASPRRSFSVERYKKLAGKAVRDILKRGKVPIVCGGTGFYIDALIYDRKLPEVPPQSDLRRKLERCSVEELFSRLLKLDPDRAENIEQKNKRRLIRALEIVITSGESVPQLSTSQVDNFDVLKIGIDVSREELRKKIDRRFKGWLREGLLGGFFSKSWRRSRIRKSVMPAAFSAVWMVRRKPL